MASTYGNVGVIIEPASIIPNSVFTIAFAPNSGKDIIPPSTVVIAINVPAGNIVFG